MCSILIYIFFQFRDILLHQVGAVTFSNVFRDSKSFVSHKMDNVQEKSNFNVEHVFTISRNETGSNSDAVNSNRDTEFSTTESEGPDCILSVLFLNNKLGAAYYKISDKQVNVFVLFCYVLKLLLFVFFFRSCTC